MIHSKTHICSKPSLISITRKILQNIVKNHEGVKISSILMQLNPKFKVFCDNCVDKHMLHCYLYGNAKINITKFVQSKKHFNRTLLSISPIKQIFKCSIQLVPIFQSDHFHFVYIFTCF